MMILQYKGKKAPTVIKVPWIKGGLPIDRAGQIVKVSDEIGAKLLEYNPLMFDKVGSEPEIVPQTAPVETPAEEKQPPVVETKAQDKEPIEYRHDLERLTRRQIVDQAKEKFDVELRFGGVSKAGIIAAYVQAEREFFDTSSTPTE